MTWNIAIYRNFSIRNIHMNTHLNCIHTYNNSSLQRLSQSLPLLQRRRIRRRGCLNSLHHTYSYHNSKFPCCRSSRIHTRTTSKLSSSTISNPSNDDGRRVNNNKQQKKEKREHPYKRFSKGTNSDQNNSNTLQHPNKNLSFQHFNFSRVIQNVAANINAPTSTNKKNSATNNSATTTSTSTSTSTTTPSNSKLLDEKSKTQIMNLLSKFTTIVERLHQKQKVFKPPSPSWLIDDVHNNINNNVLDDDDDDDNQQTIIQRIQQYKDVDKIIHLMTQESTKNDIHQLMMESTPSHYIKIVDSLNVILNQCFLLLAHSLPPKYWNCRRIIDQGREEGEEGKEREEKVLSIQDMDTSTLQSPLQNAMKLYHLLSEYNLDIQPMHYENIIKIALYDASSNPSTSTKSTSGYEIASKLFKKQINVDDSAYAPIDSRLGWDSTVEMGLFSVAMNVVCNDFNGDFNVGNHEYDIKSNGDSSSTNTEFSLGKRVGEEVMDAVDKICMISSTDQERYILAAGSALGRAGQYEALIEYIHNHGKTSSSKFGHALNAAAMKACVECEQYELGLGLYYDLGNDPSTSEWQWAGGYGSMHPLCRDLAMICMGNIRPDLINDCSHRSRRAHSDNVTKILKDVIEEGGYVSQRALMSVFRAYESSGDFERAIKLMHLVLAYREGLMEWNIVDNSVENFITDSIFERKKEGSGGDVPDHVLLTAVMDTCNAAGEFGLTLLLCRLGFKVNIVGMNADFDDDDELLRTYFESQPMLSEHDEILAASMFALCGLGCPHKAIKLYSLAVDSTSSQNENWVHSNECLDYANSLDNKSNNAWNETNRHMNRVMFAMQCSETMKDSLESKDEKLLADTVAKMTRSSLKAGQAHSGIYLAKSAASSIHKSQHSPSNTLAQRLQNFFGFQHENDNYLSTQDSSQNTFLSCSDDVLSAMMEAYRAVGQYDEALMLFFDKWENDVEMRNSVRSAPFHPEPEHPHKEWIKSCDLAIDIMMKQNHFDEALAFFEAILPSYRSKQTYINIVKGHAANENWEEVAKLFSEAEESSNLSDELAIYAMEGIAKGKINGKMRILRFIVESIASQQQMKSGAWIFQNYWELKRRLGFHYARLLMWWNDPATTQEEELRIAIQHLEQRKQAKINTLDADVIPCIIHLASDIHQKNYGDDMSSEDAVKSQSDAVELVIDAIICSFQFDEISRNDFITGAGLPALRNLGAKRSNIDLVIAMIDQGIQVDTSELIIAKKLALYEGDDKAATTIDQVLAQV